MIYANIYIIISYNIKKYQLNIIIFSVIKLILINSILSSIYALNYFNINFN